MKNTTKDLKTLTLWTQQQLLEYACISKRGSKEQRKQKLQGILDLHEQAIDSGNVEVTDEQFELIAEIDEAILVMQQDEERAHDLHSVTWALRDLLRTL